MRYQDDINTMIEWGTELNQPDFVDFLKFVLAAYEEKKIVIFEQECGETEVELDTPCLSFKKPFPDFDVVLFGHKIGEKIFSTNFKWEYTYMERFKKVGDSKFCITDEDGKETIVRYK